MKEPLVYIHRVNTIEHLRRIAPQFGVEVDLRAHAGRIKMHHEPHVQGEDFEEYLEHFHHAGIILNIKEAGIELQALDIALQRSAINTFLLDVEFPFIFTAIQQKIREIAVRFSEYESIDTVARLAVHLDWVWIDCVSQLPIKKEQVPILNQFRKCLVCPERWGRPEEIPAYKHRCQELGMEIDAVMTNEKYIDTWMKN